MKITKINGSFNEYKLELSWGELEAIYQSMAHNHTGPIADEVFDGLTWYMNNNLPLPGEDPKKKKDEKGGEEDAELDAMLPDPDAAAQDLDEPAPVSPARLPAAEVPPGPKDSGEDNAADDKLPKPPED